MLKPDIDFDYWGLPVYNLTAAIGVLFALVLLLKREKAAGISAAAEEKINISFITAGAGSLLFANVANWFFKPELFGVPLIQRFSAAGLTFYYGMFGFFAVLALMLILTKSDYKYWVNEAVPSLLIFHAFGRIGCSLAGCCYGKDIVPPIELLGLHIDLFPARELESLSLFALFYIFRFKIKNHRFPLYLLCYSVLRFLLEFGRGDDRGRFIVDFLSPAQVTSVIVWVCLLIWYAGKKVTVRTVKNRA